MVMVFLLTEHDEQGAGHHQQSGECVLPRGAAAGQPEPAEAIAQGTKQQLTEQQQGQGARHAEGGVEAQGSQHHGERPRQAAEPGPGRGRLRRRGPWGQPPQERGHQGADPVGQPAPEPGVGSASQGAVLGDHQCQQQAGGEGSQGAQGLAECLAEGGAAGAAVNKRGDHGLLLGVTGEQGKLFLIWG